jgi:transcriptional regulator with XRE-family HTH domain
MIDQKEIGKQIKKMREEIGWTQRELSIKANITITALSKIENGYTKPRYETIANLHNVMESFKNQKNVKVSATEIK